MSWKRGNGVWVNGLYKITPMRYFFKLFFNGNFVENFNTLNDAKNHVSS